MKQVVIINNSGTSMCLFYRELPFSFPCFKNTNFESHIQLLARVIKESVLNEEYETNTWVYSYILGGERYKMDGYFPQADTNFLVGVNIRF